MSSTNCSAKTFRRACKGRVKRAYSVYLKLKRQRITLDQVYDVLAIRIITDSVRTATRRSVSFITNGIPFQAASKISSPCRGRISINRCIPPSSALAA